MGLVEVGVGIVPGWGGCKELLCRWASSKKRAGGPMPAIINTFQDIAMAFVSKSAMEAQEHLFLRPHDGITMNRDRVLFDAKNLALELANNYTSPKPQALHLPGPTGHTALALGIHDFIQKGVASKHDGLIGKELARVLSGGATDLLDTVSEDDILDLERAAILTLAGTEKTLSRVEHMLKTGKPLRN